MQLAHLADVHLGHRQYGLRQREDDMVSTFTATLSEIAATDAEAVLLPGDLFHSRDLRPKNLDAAETALGEHVPDDVPVLVSRGNHDENLAPRSVTWLNYLHRRGHIVLLEAGLGTDFEAAEFERYDPENPGENAGFVDLPADDLDGPVRVFGLQWRGAKTDTALDAVARGIRETNEQFIEPAYTVLLGHFGMEDEVPALGGTITHGDLRELKEAVDYLALGHIHKRYEAADWMYNPGSPEAHSTREGRDGWDHGYYTVDIESVDDDSTNCTAEVSHHPTKRRPYHRIEFDVTPYNSSGDLETGFREHVRNEHDALDERCSREIHRKRDGSRRAPLVDLRFTGTLQFSRADLRTGELAAWAEDECDALYVQTTLGVRTADVEALLSDLEDDGAFVDGTLNTTALEREIFETIATESEYAESSESVADVLERAHAMAQAGEDTAELVSAVSERRRDLFPDLASDVEIDIPEDPFEDATDEPGEAGETGVTDESDETAVGDTTARTEDSGLGAFTSADGGSAE